MTRINLVKPEDLADQHLFAEFREIKMIPAKLRNKQWSVDIATIPSSYRMSTGHVRFFYNKLGWLYHRFNLLTKELRNRKYNIPNDSVIDAYGIFLKDFHDYFIGDEWEPTTPEIAINIQRISERLNQRPSWYRYYGEIKPPMFFIDRYNQQLLVDKLTANAYT